MEVLKKTVLALGSNLGNRAENLSKALAEISKVARILSVSKVYETEPVGFLEQDDFFNAVVLCETSLSPERLLLFCKKTETDMGRKKSFRDAPRPIDLDIIFFEGVEMTSEVLQIPHPRWSERDFVISPLFDIFDESLFEIDFKTDVRAVLNLKTKKYKPISTLKNG